VGNALQHSPHQRPLPSTRPKNFIETSFTETRKNKRSDRKSYQRDSTLYLIRILSNREIETERDFHKAVNDLRNKARRTFYAIKRNIKFGIPIRNWLKILESVIEPIALFGCEVWGLLTNQDFTKWDKHQIETLHAEFCKNVICVQCRTPNNAEQN
jgi:hypothetical protein